MGVCACVCVYVSAFVSVSSCAHVSVCARECVCLCVSQFQDFGRDEIFSPYILRTFCQ
jgi:hypothetical protein